MAKAKKKAVRRKTTKSRGPSWVNPIRNDQPLSRGSYAVNYVRQSDLGYSGSIRGNRNNPSPRRFATRREALHHGVRFTQIENHLGFYVTRSDQRPNAKVNWKTGKTNPVIGKGRTNR